MAPKDKEKHGCCSGILLGLIMSLMLTQFVCLVFALWSAISLSSQYELLLLDLILDTGSCHRLPMWYMIYFCCGLVHFLAFLPLGSPVPFPTKKSWYMVFMLIINFMLLIAGCVLLVNVNSLKEQLQRLPDELQPGLQRLVLEQPYYHPPLADQQHPADEFTTEGQYMNYVQTKHCCCGASGNQGFVYEEADFPGKYNITFPYSCCTLRPDTAVSWLKVKASDVLSPAKCSLRMSGFFHSLGCSEPLKTALDEALKMQVDSVAVTGGVAVVVSAVLMFKVIAMVLASCWRRNSMSNQGYSMSKGQIPSQNVPLCGKKDLPQSTPALLQDKSIV